MTSVKKVGKNFGSLVFAQTITTVCWAILVILVARFLGDAEYGKMSFAQSFTGILVILADCGLNVMSIREISRNKDIAGKYLTNTIIVKVILAIIAIVSMYATINLMNYPRDTTSIVILFGIGIVINTFSQYFRSVYKAFEKMQYEAYLNTIWSLLFLTAASLLLYFNLGLIKLAYVYVISEVINLILSYVILTSKFTKPTFSIDLAFCKHLIKEAFPFSMTIFVGTIYLRIDTVMLSFMKGDAVVGWYSAACMIIYSTLIIPNVFVYSVFPLMSNLYTTSKESLQAAIEKSSKYLIIGAFFLVLVLYILSDTIISSIYGNSFNNAAIALKIISFYLPLRFVNTISGFTLSSINKEPFHALGGAIGAGVNIILNMLLIPKYSFIGAAVATLLTEVILFLMYYLLVANFFAKLPILKIFPKPLFAFLFAFSLSFFLQTNVFITAVISIMTYIVLLYAIKTFDIIDRQMYEELISRTKNVE